MYLSRLHTLPAPTRTAMVLWGRCGQASAAVEAKPYLRFCPEATRSDNGGPGG